MVSEFQPIIAPTAFVVAAAIAVLDKPQRPAHSQWAAEIAALVAIISSIVAMGRAWVGDPVAVSILGGGLGALLRLDTIGATLTILVSFIGWVIARYSRTHLDGDCRQGPFTGWVCLVLASVLALVAAADLVALAAAWITTSLCLQQLLLFYRDRVAARRAARKKFIIARLGDAALIGGVALLASAYGTLDLAAISAAARDGAGGPQAQAAAAFLALAAILKSAQFPFHGWLTEVMETPTPVSALLHAGVINAGGILLIRFADVMLLAPGVLAGLAVVGGFTALFASLVMLTQPAVKTSLAWSTVAQMGFMIFECGLALWPLALLHIVAHSLYKAHAFLSAGGAVERVAALKRPGPIAVPNASAVGRAFIAALALYLLIGLGFGFAHKSPQAVALGAILIFGVAYILAQGFADAAPSALTRRTAVYAVSTSLAYFVLQQGVEGLTRGELPPTPPPGPLEWTLIALAVVSFGLVAVVQAMFPLWAHHPATAGLRVHLSNGFYANALFDRLIGGWSTRRSS